MEQIVLTDTVRGAEELLYLANVVVVVREDEDFVIIFKDKNHTPDQKLRDIRHEYGLKEEYQDDSASYFSYRINLSAEELIDELEGYQNFRLTLIPENGGSYIDRLIEKLGLFPVAGGVG